MDYVEQINLENKRKLQVLLKELPKFCNEFFRYLDTRNTSSRTRLSYAYDMRLFFEFIRENNPVYGKMDMHDIPLKVLDELTPVDIEEYLAYLSYYEKKSGQAVTNGEKGKSYNVQLLLQKGIYQDECAFYDRDAEKAQRQYYPFGQR